MTVILYSELEKPDPETKPKQMKKRFSMPHFTDDNGPVHSHTDSLSERLRHVIRFRVSKLQGWLVILAEGYQLPASFFQTTCPNLVWTAPSPVAGFQRFFLQPYCGQQNLSTAQVLTMMSAGTASRIGRDLKLKLCARKELWTNYQDRFLDFPSFETVGPIDDYKTRWQRSLQMFTTDRSIRAKRCFREGRHFMRSFLTSYFGMRTLISSLLSNSYSTVLVPFCFCALIDSLPPVSYTHLTLPTSVYV